MVNQGILKKMDVAANEVVQYKLKLNEKTVLMNSLIGKEIEISFEDEIICSGCGEKTRKSYHQGFCYRCFMKRPECSPCILRPELCEAHNGNYRDAEWAKKQCLQSHYVYLAITSGLKVGVTRSSQIPTRWIDQGAAVALKLARTPNRHIAGMMEMVYKKIVSDRTDWRKMLRNELNDSADLRQSKKELMELCPPEYRAHLLKGSELFHIRYPSENPPEKIRSLGLDKIPNIHGLLQGIKGQYLIFQDGGVFNVRKHQGYRITLSS